MRGTVLMLLDGKVEGDRSDGEPLRSVVDDGRPPVTKGGLRTSRVSKDPEEIARLNELVQSPLNICGPHSARTRLHKQIPPVHAFKRYRTNVVEAFEYICTSI